MPATITITGTAKCSHCGGVLPETTATCHWGLVPGMEYQIGDSVVWLTENGSVVPSFSIRSTRNDVWQWNAGEPSVRNALLLDIPTFGSETIGTCPHCAAIHVALAVRVANGVFAEISFLAQDDICRVFGEPPVLADIAVIHPDGSFEPRLDWYDHTLDTTAVVKNQK
jgi:hypothetical protein